MSSSHRPVFRFGLLAPRFWSVWLVILFASLLAIVPGRVRAGLGDGIARLLCRGGSKRKRIALTNLSLCYPQLSEQERLQLLCEHSRVVTHVFLGYGQLLLRSARHLRSQFDIEGLDIVERETANGAGIILLTPHSLALEYAGRGIRANAILPGLMDTPMIVGPLTASYGANVDEMKRTRDSQCPLGHMGDAWDVAHAALFLASDEAKYITGTTLVVDGGLTAKVV